MANFAARTGWRFVAGNYSVALADFRQPRLDLRRTIDIGGGNQLSVANRQYRRSSGMDHRTKFAAWILLVTLVVGGQVVAQERPEKTVSFTTPIADPELDRSQHPLFPVLELAEEAHESITNNIQDYTCTIVRRERIAGKLTDHQFIEAKVRHELRKGEEVLTPFSVYLSFVKPKSVEGREALYVEGQHAGKVFVRRGGQRMGYLSSYVKPDSRAALKENRYPITEVGFQRFAQRMIDALQDDIQHDGNTKVKFYKNAKINGRSCTRVEIIHPEKAEHFDYYRTMVFVDDEHRIPLGYVSYYWPKEGSDKPRLLEEYIYTDVQLNVGLTDTDFDRENPAYGFSRDVEREN